MASSSNSDTGAKKDPISGLDISSLSKDKKLNSLLNSIMSEVSNYAEDQIKHIRKLAHIGLALSSEKNITRLLELIVDEARALANADGGTLYIIDDANAHLRFEILQNNSMNIRMGGTSGIDITFPKVPLYIAGEPNYSNVSSHVALTGEIINIPDVYEAEGFDFTGPRKYDEASGYRSKSMLVIPLKNHENEIIGVLQLLNAKDTETGKIVKFSVDYVDLVASLASQAAVALTNTQLIVDLKDLFYSFIQTIATAIDEKSPYTGGHINRVVDLSMMITEKINEADSGPFKDIFFNQDEIEELRIAAWMHDVGKITTPEHVIDKSTKLQTIYDGINIVKLRFGLIEKSFETEYLKNKIELLQRPDPGKSELKKLKQAFLNYKKTLQQELAFIKDCSNPGEFMPDKNIDRLNQIAQKTFFHDGEEVNYLTKNELKNLSIRKGTLTEEERKIIENHAKMTDDILNKLTFPKKMLNVPKYASGHHEKLDSSGYPYGLSGKEINLQSRILAIADIFEALTAKDRPYKKPMKLSQAIKILGFMKKDRHIDPDLYDLFIDSGMHKTYARMEMSPGQID